MMNTTTTNGTFEPVAMPGLDTLLKREGVSAMLKLARLQNATGLAMRWVEEARATSGQRYAGCPFQAEYVLAAYLYEAAKLVEKLLPVFKDDDCFGLLIDFHVNTFIDRDMLAEMSYQAGFSLMFDEECIDLFLGEEAQLLRSLRAKAKLSRVEQKVYHASMLVDNELLKARLGRRRANHEIDFFCDYLLINYASLFRAGVGEFIEHVTEIMLDNLEREADDEPAN